MSTSCLQTDDGAVASPAATASASPIRLFPVGDGDARSGHPAPRPPALPRAIRSPAVPRRARDDRRRNRQRIGRAPGELACRAARNRPTPRCRADPHGGAAVFGVTDTVVVLVALRVAYGFGHSGISQSRQLVVARSVEIGLRGRVNSWIGGTHRLMFVIGPLLGGFVYGRWSEGAAFSLAGGLTALGLAFLILPGGRDDRRFPAVSDFGIHHGSLATG